MDRQTIAQIGKKRQEVKMKNNSEELVFKRKITDLNSDLPTCQNKKRKNVGLDCLLQLENSLLEKWKNKRKKKGKKDRSSR